ncbi:hypothetical protein BDV38DRAFT_284967 [Aspergillus pseudotamarii]|uniref:Uncharacterized protein n=1 Tax=Aspergillus pseudotamarii TaxID=132259 RepID=A0A5N6SNI5_ASPPS|nr:uncharacterized protein BDV38DRAFT_284967 [Aspergillus pseudotamarii]KAE8135330.1 hypothetical protein BDV38DRAFT_284967 [Aspergillus pseudotamarii]
MERRRRRSQEPEGREKERAYSEMYRIQNAEIIRARKAVLTEEKKAAFSAHKAAQMRGYRAAKKANREDKVPHDMPAKNARRNASLKAQRAGDVLQKEKASYW